VKTPLEIRTAILAAIPDLIGIRYFGDIVQPSILMLPSWVLLKDHASLDNFSLAQINVLRSVAGLSAITQEGLDEGLSYAAAKVCKLLNLYKQLPSPTPKNDQSSLLDSLIFEFDYAGYI